MGEAVALCNLIGILISSQKTDVYQDSSKQALLAGGRVVICQPEGFGQVGKLWWNKNYQLESTGEV